MRTLTIQLGSVCGEGARGQSNNSIDPHIVLCCAVCMLGIKLGKKLHKFSSNRNTEQCKCNTDECTFAFVHFRAAGDNVIRPSVPRLLVASWVPGQHSLPTEII